MHILTTPIAYLKGVGPKRAEVLQSELNIKTFEDLLNYYPLKKLRTRIDELLH